MAKFYLVADPEDGLPPIKQEISVRRHMALTAAENIDPSIEAEFAKSQDEAVAAGE